MNLIVAYENIPASIGQNISEKNIYERSWCCFQILRHILLRLIDLICSSSRLKMRDKVKQN